MGRRQSSIGLVVVGVGSLGSRRAAAVRRVAGARLVGVVDADAERARAVARRLGVVAFEGLDAALADPGVDAVVVATPHADHAGAAGAALAAGKHVLCEKPLGLDPEEAAALAASADATRFRLATGFNHRLYPPVRDALALARSGAIGRVAGLRIQIGHRASPAFLGSWHVDPTVSGGGTLADNGPHACDLARLFLGEVESASAATSDVLGLPDGCESDAFALLKTRDGRVAEVHSSWSLDSGYLTIEARGDRGHLRVETAPWRLDGRIAGGRRVRRGYLGARVAEAAHRRLFGCESSLVRELAAFVRPDDPAAGAVAGGWDGVRAAELVQAIYESARVGEEVRLRPAATADAPARTPDPARAGRAAAGRRR